MSEVPLSIHSITALDLARRVAGNRRLAIDISVAQTVELAEALIQQAHTINILIEQNHALCNELDASEEETNEQSNLGNHNSE